jgi:cytochrome c peroxidase
MKLHVLAALACTLLMTACDKEEVREDSLVARGRVLFNSTEFDNVFGGTVSCASCHPGGDMDNKKWLLPQLAPDSLSTPTLFGLAQTAPYLWFGESNDLRAVTRTVIEDILLGTVDSLQLDALVAYQLSLVVPANPWKNSDGSLTPAQERGKAVFEHQGKCIVCHSGPAFTNGQNIQVRPGALLANVPSLRWAFATAPYFYDHSKASLSAVVAHYADSVSTVQMTNWGWNSLGVTDIDLTEQEKSDLVEYLRTL